MDRSVGRREERGKPASVAVQKRNNKIDTMRLLLAALLPLAAQGFVPVTIGGPNPKTLTRLHFKVPTEPVPVVDTLEKKGNNLTWSLPGARMSVCGLGGLLRNRSVRPPSDNASRPCPANRPP